MNDAGELFNELYCINKEKYGEEKESLDKKDMKNIDDTKLSLSDDYLYESEEEEKNKLIKLLIKKNHIKNQQKMMQ